MRARTLTAAAWDAGESELVDRPILIYVYVAIDIATFIYLLVTDWPEIGHWRQVPIFIAIDGFLAMIWPIYWAVLHWLH